MASQITDNLNVLPTVQAINKKITEAPYYWPFVRGIHRSMIDSLQKDPVMRKGFPCHDVIVIYAISFCMQHRVMLYLGLIRFHYVWISRVPVNIKYMYQSMQVMHHELTFSKLSIHKKIKPCKRLKEHTCRSQGQFSLLLLSLTLVIILIIHIAIHSFNGIISGISSLETC